MSVGHEERWGVMSVRSFESVAGHAIVLGGGCLVDFYAGQPDSDHLGEVERAFLSLTEPVAYAIVVSGHARKPPDDFFRRRAVQVSERVAGRVRCRATIVEVQGMIGAAVRAIMAGIALAERTSFPQAVFGAENDALAWMAEHTPGFTDVDVRHALKVARERASEPPSDAG